MEASIFQELTARQTQPFDFIYHDCLTSDSLAG